MVYAHNQSRFRYRYRYSFIDGQSVVWSLTFKCCGFSCQPGNKSAVGRGSTCVHLPSGRLPACCCTRDADMQPIRYKSYAAMQMDTVHVQYAAMLCSHLQLNSRPSGSGPAAAACAIQPTIWTCSASNPFFVQILPCTCALFLMEARSDAHAQALISTRTNTHTSTRMSIAYRTVERSARHFKAGLRRFISSFVTSYQ